MVKPDGVTRGLVGNIITRFEQKGFIIQDLKMLQFTKKQAEEFYRCTKSDHLFAVTSTAFSHLDSSSPDGSGGT